LALPSMIVTHDWAEALTSSLHVVDRAQREALAEAWERAAQMEHASVAAFARFSLQLLALGAPANLIEATNQAASDETRHARLCFGLASHYRGRAVGPQPLDVSGALGATSLEEIVVTAIIEGCCGETAAALEAAEAASLCEDASVRALLQRIAEDETRHADLEFRFVRWAMEEHAELRSFVAAEFDRALSEAHQGENASRKSSRPGPLARYGVLDEAHRLHVRRQAYLDVIAPCARQLLREVRVSPAPSEAGRISRA